MFALQERVEFHWGVAGLLQGRLEGLSSCFEGAGVTWIVVLDEPITAEGSRQRGHGALLVDESLLRRLPASREAPGAK